MIPSSAPLSTQLLVTGGYCSTHSPYTYLDNSSNSDPRCSKEKLLIVGQQSCSEVCVHKLTVTVNNIKSKKVRVCPKHSTVECSGDNTVENYINVYF